jgi:hypothetical protein
LGYSFYLLGGIITINWTVFDDAFEQHYSQDNGRPSKPIRLMEEIRGILEKSG